jgi:hypothetical protein
VLSTASKGGSGNKLILRDASSRRRNYAGFAAPALVQQQILSRVGSGDEAREGLDRGKDKMRGASSMRSGSVGSKQLQESEQSKLHLKAPEWRAQRRLPLRYRGEPRNFKTREIFRILTCSGEIRQRVRKIRSEKSILPSCDSSAIRSWENHLPDSPNAAHSRLRLDATCLHRQGQIP